MCRLTPAHALVVGCQGLGNHEKVISCQSWPHTR